MTAAFDPDAAARWVASQHATRAPYANVPAPLTPPTIADAYTAQEALHKLWTPERGPVVGLKIATTTKVMQQLMGIDHPCAGAIFESGLHTSPATIIAKSFQHLVIECELALRLVIDLPKKAEPWTRETVRLAISTVMPSFELIEDRNAVYKDCRVTSLIADNAWNGGIVLGKPKTASNATIDGLAGQLTINGRVAGSGKTDDPLGALAWLANLAADRGRPLKANQVVITGSVMPTHPVSVGDELVFALAGLGEVRMTVA